MPDPSWRQYYDKCMNYNVHVYIWKVTLQLGYQCLRLFYVVGNNRSVKKPHKI